MMSPRYFRSGGGFGKNMPLFNDVVDRMSARASDFTDPAPHVILFTGMDRLSPNYLERPCDGEEDECRARHFFGYWQDAVTSTEGWSGEGSGVDTCDDARVDFLMICPMPHWYSLVPARSLMGLFYGGDRYIISFDGMAGGAEQVSVGLLSEGEGALMHDEDFDPRDLVAAAIYAATGREIKPYDREFSFVSVDGFSLYASGCAPSRGEGG